MNQAHAHKFHKAKLPTAEALNFWRSDLADTSDLYQEKSISKTGQLLYNANTFYHPC